MTAVAKLTVGMHHVYTRSIPGECLGVCGQTGCVPSVVASELSAQVVRGDTLAEGTCTKLCFKLGSMTSECRLASIDGGCCARPEMRIRVTDRDVAYPRILLCLGHRTRWLRV